MDSKPIKNAGLKVTLPRVKILNIFESSIARHLSAEDVYNRLRELGEDLGLATVYRVLTQFESAGLLIRHHFENEHSVFELDHGHHHDHLVCIKCGKVDEFMDEVIEERQKAIAKEHGYRMTSHCLYIYGYCQGCEAGMTI